MSIVGVKVLRVICEHSILLPDYQYREGRRDNEKILFLKSIPIGVDPYLYKIGNLNRILTDYFCSKKRNLAVSKRLKA